MKLDTGSTGCIGCSVLRIAELGWRVWRGRGGGGYLVISIHDATNFFPLDLVSILAPASAPAALDDN